MLAAVLRPTGSNNKVAAMLLATHVVAPTPRKRCSSLVTTKVLPTSISAAPNWFKSASRLLKRASSARQH